MTVSPRLMTKQEAAAYCAVTPSRFAELVEQGVYRPAPFDADLFDRRVLDAPLHPVRGTRPKRKVIQMLRKKVVGEAVFPQLGDFNSLDQGAGVFGAFDLKGAFRVAPAPRSLTQAPRHG